MKRTIDAFESDVQKTVEFTRVQHTEKIVSVPVVMRQAHDIDRVIDVAVVVQHQVQPSRHRSCGAKGKSLKRKLEREAFEFWCDCHQGQKESY